MAGKITQIATNTITSSTTFVTLTGVSTDNVHMLVIDNLSLNTDATTFFRFTASGTGVSANNYNRALKQLRVDSAFGNTGATNSTSYSMGSYSTLAKNETMQAIYYLYNLNNSSQYSIAQLHDSFRNTDGYNRGNVGGFVYDVDEAHDGITIFTTGGQTFETGTITLYRID